MKVDKPSAPIRVMLVDDHCERAQLVEDGLLSAGFEVISVITSAAGLLFQIEQHRPDVVIIDLQSPDRDVLESLAIVNQHNPTAMVMFGQEDDPDYIRHAVSAGISTYLTDGINPTRVRPIIEVAMAQFRSFQGLREELDTARAQLQSRSLVEKAKSLLMKQKNLNENEAHQLLTKLAMDNNQRLGDVAHTVVTTLSAFETRK